MNTGYLKTLLAGLVLASGLAAPLMAVDAGSQLQATSSLAPTEPASLDGEKFFRWLSDADESIAVVKVLQSSWPNLSKSTRVELANLLEPLAAEAEIFERIRIDRQDREFERMIHTTEEIRERDARVLRSACEELSERDRWREQDISLCIEAAAAANGVDKGGIPPADVYEKILERKAAEAEKKYKWMARNDQMVYKNPNLIFLEPNQPPMSEAQKLRLLQEQQCRAQAERVYDTMGSSPSRTIEAWARLSALSSAGTDKLNKENGDGGFTPPPSMRVMKESIRGWSEILAKNLERTRTSTTTTTNTTTTTHDNQ